MANTFISGVTNRLVYDLAVCAGDLSGMAARVGFLSGTITQDADSDNNAPVDVAEDVVYAHCVSNVLTYGQADTESTWGAIAIGDLVYFDPSLVVDDTCIGNSKKVNLTTSPLNDADAVNCVFGKVIGNADATAAANVAERVWIVQQKSCCGCDPETAQ